MSDQPVTIRSYRHVFRTDWRITRVWGIDFTRVWPNGLPAIPTLIACVLIVVMWIVAHIPGLGALVAAIPLFGTGVVRYGAFPIGMAVLSQQPSRDGRSQLRFAWSRLRLAMRRGWRSPTGHSAVQGEWRAPDGLGLVCVRWDGSSIEHKPGRVTGVALVRFNQPVEFRMRGGRLVARAREDGQTGPVVLMSREQLEVRA